MKHFKILYVFLFLLSLSCCSVLSDFYIQNLTNESQLIIIKYKFNIKSQLENDSSGGFSFNYKNAIANPKEFRNNKNLPELNKTVINGYQIEVILSPSSTTRVEKTLNYNWRNWSIDFIKLGNKEIKIEDIQSHSIKDKNDYIYKIE
ncbi:hypothetical protein [Chryseobacterium sp. FH1]|uniref:hypothetical protein n=1 Tax=Chryseobacterium sp. FH1 TaxID=1233951 RepID=UPI0004E3CBA2|nr:hypothetical protein [Chryseobacterium sp. FH1]KFC19256.1 hypothetical protein IO90_08045 [Chryseobacterium sp. FH1]